MSSEDGRYDGFLGGIRVLEVGAELTEYAGKVLAGLGADVVRVEPLGGEVSRTYGPFYRDEPHPDRSLYFWHYNVGKRSMVVDLDSQAGQAEFRRLAEVADVVLDGRSAGYFQSRGIDYERLTATNPSLVWSRISPFGDDGPWAGYAASDLIHLALGGVMMNCGYDPDPSGTYETPPIAPQLWQAYHIAGEMAVISILGALNFRITRGGGQYITTSVHEAVSKNTESDLPDWVFLAQTHRRLTCRHSMVSATAPALSGTKDGRYLMPYRTYLGGAAVNAWQGTIQLLSDFGMQEDLEDPKYESYAPENAEHLEVLSDKLIQRLLFDRELWRDAQKYGLPWAPIRRPEENIADEHWQLRGTFMEVEHPELDETFTYVGAKWRTEEVEWRTGPRPPLVGEHNDAVRAEWAAQREPHARWNVAGRAAEDPLLSPHGKPFALSDVLVVDLSWLLASAGAGRYLAAMGAEVIKVEHESRPDSMRGGLASCPPGGRAARDRATGPLPTPPRHGLNRSGAFMEINAGKQSLSLNLKHPSGKEVLEDLIRRADMVVEGFSPGTMERMGLGYERLKELNPSIIYVQQSGFGEYGTYGRMRAYGPTAAATAGISELSGLPEPFPPAGIGYSYLDWFGAYNMAQAMLAALYRRNATGLGCHIDASQGEIGIYLTSTATLDYSVNRRRWSRYGNASPYKHAAPHGAYRTKGDDRWIAIAAFTEDEWSSTARILGLDAAAGDPRFGTLESRVQHQDLLDALVTEQTQRWDGFELMAALQAAGVPAGVCQTAQDRYETDPQLRHLNWLVELDQTEIGRWPVKEHPGQLSETPTYIGGRHDHSGPNHGEHTDEVLSDILGMAESEIQKLREIGAV